jgi:hypothetical protein
MFITDIDEVKPARALSLALFSIPYSSAPADAPLFA